MGRGGGVPAGRPPSQAAYFVALAGVALLLLMLCCYFLYFCIKKINELSEHESLCGAPASRTQPAPARIVGYPVQPVVRDSATAMAKLCKDLPSGGARSTVFPAVTSPAALRADTGRSVPTSPAALRADTGRSVPTSPAALLADTGCSVPTSPAARGSLASGSDGATLSDDTATTGASVESPPPAAPMPDR